MKFFLLGAGLSKDQAVRVWEQLDENKNGKVSYGEFKKCSCGVLLFSSHCSRWHRVPRPRRVDGATCHAIDAMPHAGRGPAILSS